MIKSEVAASEVNFMSSAKKHKLWHWYDTSGARCIHKHEGSWTDPDPKYYGGFQADISFQRTYGRYFKKNISYLRRYGTANHWPVILQIHMAKHGWNARGFAPWPSTRLMCGV